MRREKATFVLPKETEEEFLRGSRELPVFMSAFYGLSLFVVPSSAVASLGDPATTAGRVVRELHDLGLVVLRVLPSRQSCTVS